MVLNKAVFMLEFLLGYRNFMNRKKQGFSIKAYPAIVDEKIQAGIKLFETELEQQVTMQ